MFFFFSSLFGGGKPISVTLMQVYEFCCVVLIFDMEMLLMYFDCVNVIQGFMTLDWD